MEIRVFIIALLFLASPFLQAARCQSESQDVGAGNTGDSGDLEIVNETDETPFLGDENFSPATGVETVCVFPKNIAKLVSAGEETELLIGIKYDGDSNVNVVAIKASVHLSYDHRMLVQNLTAQSVSINEFLKPAEGESYYRPGGRGRGRGGRGQRGGGGVGGGRGYEPRSYDAPAPLIGDPGHFPSLK